ncbi:MAG: GNAT family N-acetyltransferase [Deferribacteres bacterium]|nr:GNAT family N-acetyltransferase [candidate division KSB1 bacterium]MCB9503358.1 GNAT family N-acetyltransferase [Deferribacteres bacterium]
MCIKLIQNVDDWKSQQDIWNDVFESNSNHTPFQSFEWLSSWWEYLGDGKLYIVRIDKSDGEVVGFAPFFIRKKYFGFPLRHLALIGVKRTDYLDFVVREGQEDFFFKQLFHFLSEKSKAFSFIELKDVPDTSKNMSYLIKYIGEYFPIYALESSRICVTLPLPTEWEDFLSGLGKRTRKDVGYDRRYIAKRHETRLEEFINGKDISDAYDDLVHIYNERWIDEKGATRYNEGPFAQFERTVCKKLAARGDYRLWILYADDKPVAGISGYERNNKIYADVYAHSPQWHNLSVGNIVLGHAIENSIERGIAEFDLSRGDEPYKYRWKGQEKRNFHFKIFVNHKIMAAAGFIEHLYLSATNSQKLQKLYSTYRKIRFGEV